MFGLYFIVILRHGARTAKRQVQFANELFLCGMYILFFSQSASLVGLDEP